LHYKCSTIFEFVKNNNVIAAGHRTDPSFTLRDSGPFERIDVTDRNAIEQVVKRYEIDTIYHMAAILSAVGEEKPQLVDATVEN